MRKKYQIGGVMGSSSSPLTSLMPLTSPFQKPNFGNAFLFNPLALLLRTPLMPDYALEFKNEWLPKIDKIKLLTGLATQNSSNPVTALKGKEMVNEVVNGSNTSLIIPSAQGNTTSFSDKFSNSTFGKNFGAWSVGLDIANTAFTGLFGEKEEYSGEKGDITRTMDSTYDSIQNLAGSFGPIGQFVSLGMGAHKLLGNVANKLGGGTDGMTTTDAILGSSFLLLTPIGLINGFGGSKTNTITKDTLAFETVGSSYTGSNKAVDEALEKSGKKYGLFSQGARNRANEEIEEARRLQYVISNIADEATERFAIRNSMSAINGNRRALTMLGGYDQASIRVGKSGLKINTIERAKSILSKYKEQLTNLLQLGGTIDPFEHYLSTLPENQRDSTNFRVKDYWIFNDRPKDFKEARRRGMFTLDKLGLFHAKSIAKNPETGEIEYMKASSHPTRYMESDWYEKGLIYNEDLNGNTITIQLKPGVPGYEDWKQFTNDYELVKSEPYWKYVKRLLKEIPSHKDGGTFIEISTETSIELVDPTSIPEFQNGGTISTKIVLTNPELVESPKRIRTLEELIEYAKKENPRFILRMSEPLKFVEWEDDKGKHFGTHEMTYGEADGRIFVFPMIQEIDGNLVRYLDSTKALFNALDNKNVLLVNNEDEAKLFSESEELPDGTFTGYKSGWVDFFKLSPSKFLNGGSINVIPDGALHARKHNMGLDGITRKGIPVVSEKDGEIEQLAEIEKEEIIFRLEVTLKLEELEKKFYSDESTQEEKDECALEAGKLLVNEILYNTLDNTNNLL